MRRAAGYWSLIASLALSACAYDPPMRADHATPSYQADLAACRKSGVAEADRRMNAFAYLFLTYPISYPFERRQRVRLCMQGKGYALR